MIRMIQIQMSSEILKKEDSRNSTDSDNGYVYQCVRALNAGNGLSIKTIRSQTRHTFPSDDITQACIL